MAMTPEEQKVFDEMKTQLAQANENIRKQNQYITKLEGQRGQAAPTTAAPEAPKANAPQGQKDVYQRFIEEQMREKALDKAIAHIKAHVSEEEYKAVEKDFLEFLNQNMRIENTTQEFIVDAFNLVMGRARMLKDHAINQIGKGSTPAATPTPPTNGATIAAVQSVIANQPPVMSDKDKSAASGTSLPNVPQGIKNTKDAFANLRQTFAGAGGNKYQ